MKLSHLFLLTILSIFGCKNTAKQPETTKEPIQLSMDSYADSLLMDSMIHSASIVVYKDGEEYTGHYGELDPGKGNKPNDQTIYEIASVSKTFAGALAAQGVIDGKISLDDDIRDYLKGDFPNLSYNETPIRVRDLLTHTSRLPRFLPVSMNDLMTDFNEELPFKIHEIEKNYSKEQFFKDLREITIDTIPGTTYEYSNADTELMAAILEEAYGKTYEELLDEKICAKAGMRDTKIALNDEQKRRLANGYGMTSKLTPHMESRLWGAGGNMKSTTADLLTYIKLQLGTENEGIVKSHEVLKEWETTKTGYYWPIDESPEDGVYYRHHGGAFGMQNWFFIAPKYNIGISIITNQSDMETGNKLWDTMNGIFEEIK